MQEKLTKAFEMAADLWANETFKDGNQDNGDAFQSAFADYAATKSRSRIKDVERAKDLFRAQLIIEMELDYTMYRYRRMNSIVTATDYDPEYALRDACQALKNQYDIDLYSIVPIKSCVRIDQIHDMELIEINYRFGYGSDWQKIIL